MLEPTLPQFRWQNYLLKYEEPVVTPVVVEDNLSISIPVLSLVALVIFVPLLVFAIKARGKHRAYWSSAAIVAVLAAVMLLNQSRVKMDNPFAGLPDGIVMENIVATTLGQISIAYLEKVPDRLESALQVIVAGDSLVDVKRELDRALAIRVVGGGIAKVKSIDDLSMRQIAALEDKTGFRTTAEWTANASAGHWGHNHSRRIRFQALVELVREQGAWKLDGITVTDARDITE